MPAIERQVPGGIVDQRHRIASDMAAARQSDWWQAREPRQAGAEIWSSTGSGSAVSAAKSGGIRQIEDLDHEPFVGDPRDHMAQNALHGHAFAAACQQNLFDGVERLLGPGSGIGGIARRATFPAPRPGDRSSRAAARPRSRYGPGLFGKDAVATESAIATPRNPIDRNGRIEVVRDPLSLLFRRRIEQPHQHEEGHHRGHEVGIGHLPGTRHDARHRRTTFLRLMMTGAALPCPAIFSPFVHPPTAVSRRGERGLNL